jgi:hypothetical protein
VEEQGAASAAENGTRRASLAAVHDIGKIASSEGVSAGDSCRLAQVSYADARAEQARWRMLVFVVACAVAVFFLVGLGFVVLGNDDRGAAIVAFAGSALSGVAMGWFVKQRNGASKQVDQALALVHDFCGQPDRTIERLDAGAAPTELVVGPSEPAPTVAP